MIMGIYVQLGWVDPWENLVTLIFKRIWAGREILLVDTFILLKGGCRSDYAYQAFREPKVHGFEDFFLRILNYTFCDTYFTLAECTY